MPPSGAETPRRAAGRGRRIRQRIEWQKANRVVERRHAGILHPRAAQQIVAAANGGAAAPEGRDRELSEGQSEELEAVNHPDDPAAGTRRIAFGRELYIEQDDFHGKSAEEVFPPLAGHEVRLRFAYFIKCTEIIKNGRRRGHRAALHLRSGPKRQRTRRPQVKATMHGCRRPQSLPAEIRGLQSAVRKPNPDAANFAAESHPQSLEVLSDARIESAIAETNSLM